MTATSLRVLIILSQQPSETGSGVYLKEVVEELRELGHVPYLLAAHYRPLSSSDFPSLSDDQIFTLIFSNHENTDDAEISFPIPGMSLDMPYLHVNFRDLTPEMLDEYCTVWLKKIRQVVNLVIMKTRTEEGRKQCKRLIKYVAKKEGSDRAGK